MFNTDDVGSVTDAHIPSIVIRCMSFDLCPKIVHLSGKRDTSCQRQYDDGCPE